MDSMNCVALFNSITHDEGIVNEKILNKLLNKFFYQYLFLKDLIKKGDNKLFINELSNCGVLAEHRDEIYNDSSWGTTSDLQFKPEIMAPGSNIYSLANGDSYQYMSGTSMATPCISGAEALILESVKKKNLQLSGSELVKFIKNTCCKK